MEEKIRKIFDTDKVAFEKVNERIINFYVYKSLFDPFITSTQLIELSKLTGDNNIIIAANSKYVFNIICDLTNGKN